MNQTIENNNYIAKTRSYTGLKHINLFQPCQDSSAVVMTPEYTLITAADGHSGKAHYLSESGSRIACESAAEIFDEAIKMFAVVDADERSIFEQCATNIAKRWRSNVIEDFSRRCSKPYSDSAKELIYAIYGTTLLFACVFRRSIILGQIGDGAIVVRKKDGKLITPIPKEQPFGQPDSLCLANAETLFRTVVIPSADVDSVLISTDGLTNCFADEGEFLLEADRYLSNRRLSIPLRSYDDTSAAAIWLKRESTNEDTRNPTEG